MLLRTTPVTASRPAPARRVAIVPRAGLRDIVDSVAEGFVRIFSPPRVDKDVPIGGGQGYSRSSVKKGGRKPFADNYSAAVAVPQQQEQVKDQTSEEAASYLGGAVQRVMGHNFVGDEETEPDWKSTGGQGWSGDIHKGKDRDGFHTKSY